MDKVISAFTITPHLHALVHRALVPQATFHTTVIEISVFHPVFVQLLRLDNVLRSDVRSAMTFMMTDWTQETS